MVVRLPFLTVTGRWGRFSGRGRTEICGIRFVHLLQCYLHPPALALHQVFVHVSAKGLGFGCTPLGGSAGDLFWEYLIDLKILGHHLWFMDIIPALISKFDLSAAKLLNLEVDMGILQPSQYLTCMPLFFTFSSVTSLQVRQDDLGIILILSTYSGNPRSFVPQLNTLYVNSFKLSDPGASTSHPLLSFLRHRRDLELPVREVVVSLTNNQEASDLKFLDEMVGLSVYWYDRNGKAFEYICGSITTYA
ncbi:hypothetical protein CPB84DRAFT_1219737 [Gymnopilus junonius]|uniref:Uncharacterized protein n=1 Tax=Gymnopilus junonius TaxID=109634 RepID=A0A9P5NXX3_GYMJU|nr:hypothetical protein CPB84DRAFT_1219737 [Gymnopilus junonius]